MNRSDRRFLVFASLGSAAWTGELPFFPRIITACAGLDLRFVLSLGSTAIESAGSWVRVLASKGSMVETATIAVSGVTVAARFMEQTFATAWPVRR